MINLPHSSQRWALQSAPDVVHYKYNGFGLVIITHAIWCEVHMVQKYNSSVIIVE